MGYDDAAEGSRQKLFRPIDDLPKELICALRYQQALVVSGIALMN
jgi:hypothetical protein